jgi:hypothetical protein
VPKKNSQSSDTFTYTVSDGTHTATATVTMNVFTPSMYVQDAFFVSAAGRHLTRPAAAGLLASVPPLQGSPLQITAVNGSAQDVGKAITLASGATLTVNADGSFTYVAAAGFSGQDRFTFTVDGVSYPLTVTIFVVPISMIGSPNQVMLSSTASATPYSFGGTLS